MLGLHISSQYSKRKFDTLDFALSEGQIAQDDSDSSGISRKEMGKELTQHSTFHNTNIKYHELAEQKYTFIFSDCLLIDREK